MPKVIAVAGKGGTGKTTFCGLLMRSLVKKGLSPILAVDADPNTNLKDVLGVIVEETVGSICEETRLKDVFPGGMTKNDYLKYRIEQGVVEHDKFDLLTMGRPEGPGCYCYANNVLRAVFDILLQNYKYAVMDNEAGFEHLSRKTTRNVDVLFIVSDPSLRGINTAGKIRDLVGDLGIPVKEMFLIINRAQRPLDSVDALLPMIKKQGLTFAGFIPEDQQVADFELRGRPLLELPDTAAAVAACEEILNRLMFHDINSKH